MTPRLRVIPALHRATHAVGLAIGAIPGAGVNQGEAHVLAHLQERGASRISEIHAAFGHRRSTLTSILDRLESANLITRNVDAKDRRSVLVSLTAVGKRRAARVTQALHATEAGVVAALTETDIEGFLAVCSMLSAQT